MRRLIFLLAVLCAAVSCKDSSVDDRVEPMLKVTPESVVLSYEKQSVELTVETNLEDIDVREEVLWINVNGVEDGKVRLTVLKNDADTSREADVTITAGELSCKVHIVQSAKGELLTLKLGHSSDILDSPQWGGEGVSGTIDWGDGTNEAYEAGASHEYPNGDRHTATFVMENATSFEISRVGEIESLEISL